MNQPTPTPPTSPQLPPPPAPPLRPAAHRSRFTQAEIATMLLIGLGFGLLLIGVFLGILGLRAANVAEPTVMTILDDHQKLRDAADTYKTALICTLNATLAIGAGGIVFLVSRFQRRP